LQLIDVIESIVPQIDVPDSVYGCRALLAVAIPVPIMIQ
jgi:hypothetical protein